MIDLGDAFSLDDATETQATVRTKYLNQRAFFQISGHSSPVFLVLGNHENEEGWNLDDMGANVAATLPVLGANARKRFFLNPVPDAFYAGNDDPLPQLDGDHLRGDYYAFEWGNALFVAIDPYAYTMKKPFAGTLGGEKNDETVGDRWDWTLGRKQYLWLKQTLENSQAAHKFVFAHHMTGGIDDYVRGGALGAKYGEWGGYDIDGVTWGFGTHRPGWEMPVHQLLAQNHVNIFFHGHDHVFAKEVLDGVVYQECPHAANHDYGTGFATNPSDYADTTLVANSGYVRVTVAPGGVKVEYVRSYLPGEGSNGSVAYFYNVQSSGVQDTDAADGGTADGGEAGTGGGDAAGDGAGAGEETGLCRCTGTGTDGPVTADCGQSACGSDHMIYSCSEAGWSWTGQSCPSAVDAGGCNCLGTGPGGVLLTADCGQSACGSDYMTYSCGSAGWLWTGQGCTSGAVDAGACACLGTGPGDAPVSADCGQSACGSDYMSYSCNAAGWSWTGQGCTSGAADAGACACLGTGPGDVPVSADCGQSACGSDYMTYSCGSAGWLWTGQGCTSGAVDAGACACLGTGPGDAPVSADCGQSACGSDYMSYSCNAAGWSWTGDPCQN